MQDAVKYPKTMHLPWSPGLQNDDRVIANLDAFCGHEVVVTEKLDGENTSMYRMGIHARSIDGRYHASRDWVKRFWGENICLQLPPGVRICGENVYAQHSIVYADLETYFYGFSYWDGDVCLPWTATEQLFLHYGVTPVPVLYRGIFSEAALHEIEAGMDFERQEGYVVRIADRAFTMAEFPRVVAKYVRKGHVQTDEHWMHKEIKPNGIRQDG
jgi:ATP-dependent RNA circularization protein (DNA/RNA ligase family)